MVGNTRTALETKYVTRRSQALGFINPKPKSKTEEAINAMGVTWYLEDLDYLAALIDKRRKEIIKTGKITL